MLIRNAWGCACKKVLAKEGNKEDFWQLMYNKEDKEDNKEDFFGMCTRKTFLATDVDVGIHLEEAIIGWR